MGPDAASWPPAAASSVPLPGAGVYGAGVWDGVAVPVFRLVGIAVSDMATLLKTWTRLKPVRHLEGRVPAGSAVLPGRQRDRESLPCTRPARPIPSVRAVAASPHHGNLKTFRLRRINGDNDGGRPAARIGCGRDRHQRGEDFSGQQAAGRRASPRCPRRDAGITEHGGATRTGTRTSTPRRAPTSRLRPSPRDDRCQARVRGRQQRLRGKLHTRSRSRSRPASRDHLRAGTLGRRRAHPRTSKACSCMRAHAAEQRPRG